MAGLFLFAMVFIYNSPNAHAEAPQSLLLNENIATAVTNTDKLVFDLVENKLKQTDQMIPADQLIPVKAEPTKYTVVKSDTLSSIAKQFDSTWQRIFDKNTEIKSPDSIIPGDEIVIPAVDEVIPGRETEISVTPVTPVRPAQNKPRSSGAGLSSSSGNKYIAGYCTWYVKNRRPDLPNNLGNANTWVMRALSQGLSTGSSPRVGAVGQQGMHVVVVDRVNSDGTVLVSEMNYQGFNVISSRTVAASNFQYIY